MWLTGLVALRHVGSSWARARTHVPCIGRQILNHCATREAPRGLLDCQAHSRISGLAACVGPQSMHFCLFEVQILRISKRGTLGLLYIFSNTRSPVLLRIYFWVFSRIFFLQTLMFYIRSALLIASVGTPAALPMGEYYP